ncbi:hypothetical protein H0H92_015505, partial [Tricholoma furcatifolium]
HHDSEVRQSRLLTEKAPIGKAKLRRNLRLIIQGPPLTISGSNDDEDETGNDSSGDDESSEETEGLDVIMKTSQQKANKEIRRRLSLLPSVHSQLSKVDGSLGDLFKRLYDENRSVVPWPYKRFFMQVS